MTTQADRAAVAQAHWQTTPRARITTGWQDQAACKGKTAIFWPSEKPSKATDWSAARATCDACPVRGDCLDAALTARIIEHGTGMWGGTLPEDRARMLDRQRRGRRAS